jgi:hypothetical protein
VKSDNNNQIFPKNDYIKQIFSLLVLIEWSVLCKTENINQKITLTVITISGGFCNKLNVRVFKLIPVKHYHRCWLCLTEIYFDKIIYDYHNIIMESGYVKLNPVFEHSQN